MSVPAASRALRNDVGAPPCYVTVEFDARVTVTTSREQAMRPKLLTNAERQARWRAKRNALVRKAVLDQARKPWDLCEARKGDAYGHIYEAQEWWMSYEYRLRKELELCPATFSDQDDRAEMVRTLEAVGEGIRQLAQKVRSSAVT